MIIFLKIFYVCVHLCVSYVCMSPWKSEEGVDHLEMEQVFLNLRVGAIRVLSALSPKLSHFSTCSFMQKWEAKKALFV